MTLKILKYFLFLSIIGLLLFSTWFAYEFYFPPKHTLKKIDFEVIEGENAASIADNLKSREVIKKKWPFLLGYKLFYTPQTLKAGEYIFETPVSTKAVLQILTEGKVILYPITVPEGLTRTEIAEYLESSHSINKEELLETSAHVELISDWDQKAQDLEGYLFPETYNFPKNPSASKVVATMVSQFKAAFSDARKNRADELGMSIRDVVILASLIEKETSLSKERPLVSSVFHNRLKLGMKLDCDPTIVYVLKQAGIFKDRLRTKDLKFNSPYNTYLYSGLPPGPITNPGSASLEAALYPAKTKYLYFVSKNDGSHHFSQTFREHQNAVIRFQKQRR
jgi:UPF0755 protein